MIALPLNLDLLNRPRQGAEGNLALVLLEGVYRRIYKKQALERRVTKRGIPEDNEKGGPSLTGLVQVVYPPKAKNAQAAFESRGLDSLPETPKNPVFSVETGEELPAHRKAVQVLLTHFLRQTINDLSRDPLRLAEIATQVRQNLTRFGLEARPIKAFEQVRLFDQLIPLLKTLEHSQSHHRFELATALILQFASFYRA